MFLSEGVQKLKLRLKSFFERKDVFHKSFELGILIKAIDGVLEIVGGVLLMFINPERINKLVLLLTQHELSEDPDDIIANYMIKLSSSFSINARNFGIFYLISHGVIKLILIILLWQKKTWSYPLAIFFLVIFIFYQIYRYTITHSIWLILLTLFDIIMIILTWIEYKRRKTLLKTA